MTATGRRPPVASRRRSDAPSVRIGPRLWAGGAALTAIAQVVVIVAAPPGFWSLPLTRHADRLQATLASWNSGEVERARQVLSANYALLVAWVALLSTASFWRAGVEPRGVHLHGFWRRPAVHAAVAVLAGAADLVVTVRYEALIAAFRRDAVVAADTDWTSLAALARVALTALVALHLVRLVPQRLTPPIGGVRAGPPDRRPAFLWENRGEPGSAGHPWEPPIGEERVGIAVGDQIDPDAAATALAELQAGGVLGRARYLATTTARGPLAAVVGRATAPAGVARFNVAPPGAARSDVSRHVAAVVANVAVVALLLVAVSRPVGWLLSSDALYPELRAEQPSLTLAEPLHAGARRLVALKPAAANSPSTATAIFELVVSWRELRIDVERAPGDRAQTRLPVLLAQPGLVGLEGDRLIVLRQPRLQVDNAPLAAAGSTDPTVDRPIAIGRQPIYGFPLRSGLAPAELDALRLGRAGPALVDDVAELLDLEVGPTVAVPAPGDGRAPWSPRWWTMWSPVAAALFTAGLIALRRRPAQVAAAAAAASGAAAGLVTVALPWVASQRQPPGWVAAVLALVSVAVPLAVAAAPGEAASTGHRRRGWTALGWTALAVQLGAALGWIALVVHAAALNGPFGDRASEVALLPGPVAGADLLRWLAVVAVLLVGWRAVDARPRPRPRSAGAGPDPGRTPGPQLVVCTRTRPLRPPRAAVADLGPFTISVDEVGGPSAGYLPPALLATALSDARRSDLTLDTALALVGERGHRRTGTAVTSGRWLPWGPLRALGDRGRPLWVCHPEWVQRFVEVEAPRTRWSDRPGWPYLLRELAGHSPQDGRYLAIEPTDANASVVELLRRGCLVVYAVGVGLDHDGRAELAARARRDLGVELRWRAEAGGVVTGQVRYPSRARHDRRKATGHIVLIGDGLAAAAIAALPGRAPAASSTARSATRRTPSRS